MPQLTSKGLLYTQPYYDTIIIPAGAAGAVVGTFFQVPFGGLMAAVVKNARHTNLVQAGRLEEGKQLSIGAISMHWPITAEAGALPTVADKRASRAGNIRLMFGGDTEFLRVPVTLLPSAGAGEVVVDATVALNDVQPGVQVAQNKFFLAEALPLAGNETVQCFIENMDAIVAPTEMTMVLWGLAIRPVR